jgi:hypothetical protein
VIAGIARHRGCAHLIRVQNDLADRREKAVEGLGRDADRRWRPRGIDVFRGG